MVVSKCYCDRCGSEFESEYADAFVVSKKPKQSKSGIKETRMIKVQFDEVVENMTHLDMIKHFLETDPWEIAHRLFDCFDCPKLKECNVMSVPYKNKNFGWTPKEICRICINEWLNEEV